MWLDACVRGGCFRQGMAAGGGEREEVVTWEKLVVVGWGALWNEYHMLVGAELAAAACVDTACVRGLVRGSPALVTSWMSRTRGHTICSTSHWRVLSVHSSIDPSIPSRSTNCAERERGENTERTHQRRPRSAPTTSPPPSKMPNGRERERGVTSCAA